MKRAGFALLIGLLFTLLGQLAVQAGDDIRPAKTEWDHGILFWKSTDGDFAGRFDTRAYMNGAYFFENKNKLSNGTHPRKIRFALKMKLWRNWYTEWDIDVAEGVVEVKDMYLAYLGFRNSHIKVGNFKVPFGLEILTSSRYIPFVERAYFGLADKLQRRMSLEYSRWGTKWNVRAALFGQQFDTRKNKTKDETGGGLAARLAVTPVQNQNMILHLGLSGVWVRPNDETWIQQFKAEPETKIGDVEMLDTGPIKNVSHDFRVGLEGAMVYHNFHLQGEYVDVKLYSLKNKFLNGVENVENAKFSAGYVYLLWTLTGESRPWDPTQGEFSQLIPQNPGLGAWEVGFRYSHLNLSDTEALILGGRANNYTFALNWYPNANIVNQLNYTIVHNSENATGDGMVGGDRFSYIQFMIKFFF